MTFHSPPACALLLAGALALGSCSGQRARPEPAHVLFSPSRERVLYAGDSEPVVTSWLALGLSFETAKQSILYGLLLADAPLLDDARTPTGTIVPDRSRLRVDGATAWEKDGNAYRRWYLVSVEAGGSSLQGLVDCSVVALITAESGGIAAGFMERKIAVSGGDSLYNVLTVADGKTVTLMDTSSLVFPDSFHPSAAARIAIRDVNADGVPEIVLDADTIVSLQFLGASPLAWQAWLQKKGPAWTPVFRFNESYGTDQGSSTQSSCRAFSSSGAGFLDTVKVTTHAVETTDQGEFRAAMESYFVWDGSTYRHDPSQDLPQEGTVVGGAQMTAGPGTGRVVQALSEGDRVYVFDRSDLPRAGGGRGAFWYNVVTKSGTEGWVDGERLALTRIDPFKENRESFLGRSPFSPPAPMSESSPSPPSP